MSKLFYSMRLSEDEDGLSVVTTKYVPIHETECICFCVHQAELSHFNSVLMREGESKLAYAKRSGIKVRQIHKAGSRIAFPTKEQALKHLLWMKSKQIRHMQRQIEFNKAFIDKCKGMDDLKLEHSYNTDYYIVPGTRDLVHEYLVFD